MKRLTDNKTRSFNIEQAYNENKYIVAYRSIYQPFYSQAQGKYYAHEIYYEQSGNLTLAGRYFHMTGNEVNRLIGIRLVNSL